MARLSAGTLLLGMIAVMFGLAGAFIVKKGLHHEAPQVAEVAVEPTTVMVPRASVDLEAGRKLTLGDITIHRLTAEQMQSSGVSGVFMTNTQQIMGRVLRSDLKQGATFRTEDLYPEGTGPSIAEMLESGQRAVTVNVEGPAAVSGFASPGTMVDVLFRVDSDDERNFPEMTVTLLENVRVLALNNTTFPATNDQNRAGATKDSSVTLAVSAKDAAALRVVDGRGSLSLALRNSADREVLVSNVDQPQTLDQLLGRKVPDAPAVVVPVEKRHRIEVFRGRAVTEVDFRDRSRDSQTTPELVNAAPAAAATSDLTNAK